MEHTRTTRRVAILATDGVERVELTEPKNALQRAGMQADLIAPKSGTIQSHDHETPSEKIPVDRTLDSASPSEYDALVLPGGVSNPDKLRINDEAVAFVQRFVDEGKPVAAICHGPWLLVEADVVRGMHVTSWPSLKTDLKNAGAEWSDEPVVEDQWLVTSRKPDDLPAFCERAVALFERDGTERRTGRQAVTA